jgi:hypothetical protein
MVHKTLVTTDLKASAIDYATALRMGDGVPKRSEAKLYEDLKALREQLSDDKELDRGLVTLLMELVVTSWGSTPRYAEATRREVIGSVALMSEAVMAVLGPDEMPPPPA